jgi:endonuclease YncB( thermonuclease family)
MCAVIPGFFCCALTAALWAAACMPAAIAGTLPLPGPYAADVERVVDGDTLGVRVTIWLGQELNVLVRIRGIDAPEMRGRCNSEKERARDAAAALQGLVSGGTVVLTGIEGDKFFGRVVADVATSAGVDIATALIAGGHARAYDGGARGSWCDLGARETDDAERLARSSSQ